MKKLSEMSSKELNEIATKVAAEEHVQAEKALLQLFEMMIDVETPNFGNWKTLDDVEVDIETVRLKGKNFTPVGLREMVITRRINNWIRSYVATGENSDEAVRLYLKIDLRGEPKLNRMYYVLNFFAPSLADAHESDEFQSGGARLSPELFSDFLSNSQCTKRMYVEMGRVFIQHGEGRRLSVLIDHLMKDASRKALIVDIVKTSLIGISESKEPSLLAMLFETNVKGLDSIAKKLLKPITHDDPVYKGVPWEYLDGPLADYMRQYYTTKLEKQRLESVLEVKVDEPKRKRVSPF